MWSLFFGPVLIRRDGDDGLWSIWLRACFLLTDYDYQYEYI